MSPAKPRSHAVSKKHVTELLSDPQWARDEELERKINFQSGRMFRHPNGQLLVVMSDGKGRLSYSREEFVQLLESRPKKPFSVLKDRLPQGETFISQVEDLLKQLTTHFKLTPEQLDMTDESLDRLTAKIKKKGYTKCFEPPIFPAIVAYIGEVMRRRLNGEWRMRLNEDGETWEPWIIAGDHAYNPWMDLVKDLEDRQGLSLKQIVYSRVRSRRPNPPGLGVTPAQGGAGMRGFSVTLVKRDDQKPD